MFSDAQLANLERIRDMRKRTPMFVVYPGNANNDIDILLELIDEIMEPPKTVRVVRGRKTYRITIPKRNASS